MTPDARLPEPIKRRSRERVGVCLAVLFLTFTGWAGMGILQGARAAGSERVASSARTIYLVEKGHLHLVGHPGVEFTEEGQGEGTYRGSVTIELTLAGSRVKAKYLARSSHGNITGSATGRVIGSTTQPVVHFSGVLSIGHGTGNFAHASGSLQIRGAITRRSYALEEETRGNIHI